MFILELDNSFSGLPLSKKNMYVTQYPKLLNTPKIINLLKYFGRPFLVSPEAIPALVEQLQRLFLHWSLAQWLFRGYSSQIQHRTFNYLSTLLNHTHWIKFMSDTFWDTGSRRDTQITGQQTIYQQVHASGSKFLLRGTTSIDTQYGFDLRCMAMLHFAQQKGNDQF